MELVPVSFLHGLSFVIGLILGSFTSALTYRLPRDQGFVHGRSRCPTCKTTLSAADLVPVLSWVTGGGKCRHCQAPISWRYPIIELICGCLFLSVSLTALPEEPVRAGVTWIMAVLLLSLTVIDLEAERLPNSLVLWVAGIGLVLVWLGNRSFPDAIALCLAVFLAAITLRFLGQAVAGKPGVGWGDIKLGTALALAIPADSAAVFLGVSGLIAVVSALELGWRRHREVIPVGPALCAGVFAVLL